jgi:hypothetical protein
MSSDDPLWHLQQPPSQRKQARDRIIDDGLEPGPPGRTLSPAMQAYVKRKTRAIWFWVVVMLGVISVPLPVAAGYWKLALLGGAQWGLIAGAIHLFNRSERDLLRKVLTCGEVVVARLGNMNVDQYNPNKAGGGDYLTAEIQLPDGRKVTYKERNGALQEFPPGVNLRVLALPNLPVVVPLVCIGQQV